MFLCDNIHCLVASDDVHDTYVVCLPGVSINQCVACKQSKYCSKTCQREAWTNGHRFSCQQLLAKAAGKRPARRKMFDGIEKRMKLAIQLDTENKLVELGNMQDSLLGDADALLTNSKNEFLIFRIYDMLARVHQKNKNVHEFHRFNLMTKYIADRMDDSACAKVYKTTAYISVGQTTLVLGRASESILLHTACLEFCKEYPNEQRHVWTKRAHAYMELGQYETCIKQIQHAICFPVSSSSMVTPNLPRKNVEIANQLILLAQSNRGLGNYNRALLFQKILWYYARVKKLKEFVYLAQSGIATVIYERAHHQQAKLLAQHAVNAHYGGCLPGFATSLKQATKWYIKDPNNIGGLYASTFLQLAFIYHDLAKHSGTPQHEEIFTTLAAQQRQAEELVSSPVAKNSLSANTDDLSEVLAIHMASEHNTYLMKYLQQLLENGHKKCSFCEQCRSANDTLLTCTGCGVVRFCNKQHQKMASKRMSTFSGRYVIRHHSVCKLLRHYVMFINKNSVQNTHAYLKEQRLFLARGL